MTGPLHDPELRISETGDNLVLPFQTLRSGVTGRLVRLGSVVDTILTRHDFPESVSIALGQAVALTAALGAALKFDGKLILQTKTDGILDFLVVNYETPGKLRAYARYDKTALSALSGDVAQGVLIGSGYLAMTIDQGTDMERYQGIVALSGETLTGAAHTYFRQSEQLPTFLRLAVARHFRAGRWSWRAGALLIQHVATRGGIERAPSETEADEQRLEGEDDDAWQRVRLLAATVEDHELLDPTLAPERLLYRLFHEEGVTVTPPRPLDNYCRCSRERVHMLLRNFGAQELADMREPNGGVSVTCEFCTTKYQFAQEEIE